jgi:hypothetical protein
VNLRSAVIASAAKQSIFLAGYTKKMDGPASLAMTAASSIKSAP